MHCAVGRALRAPTGVGKQRQATASVLAQGGVGISVTPLGTPETVPAQLPNGCRRSTSSGSPANFVGPRAKNWAFRGQPLQLTVAPLEGYIRRGRRALRAGPVSEWDLQRGVSCPVGPSVGPIFLSERRDYRSLAHLGLKGRNPIQMGASLQRPGADSAPREFACGPAEATSKPWAQWVGKGRCRRGLVAAADLGGMGSLKGGGGSLNLAAGGLTGGCIIRSSFFEESCLLRVGNWWEGGRVGARGAVASADQ
mmetsp:Transcript_111479/g.193437  ORF Transcript_111479/g.193437 Transcript_111479/m.193437 type:complete len:253 (+) Transcript_111479:1538-2296(+)